MQVVILCGGRGIRLSEQTDLIPKPLVKIGDYPILVHIMRIFLKYKYNNFILNLGYKGEKEKEYFLNYRLYNYDFLLEKNNKISFHKKIDDSIDDSNIIFSSTGITSNKAKRILDIKKYITNEEFLITYGDGLANININKLIKFHRKHKKILTLTGVNTGGRFGEISIKNNLLQTIDEKPNISNRFINGGFFVANKKIFNFIKIDEDQDFETHTIPSLVKIKEVSVFEHPGFWSCLDTQRDFIYLNELNKKKIKPWEM